jgi:DNA repair protein RadC
LRNNFSDDTIDYRETFKVLYLNQNCQILGCFTISEGGITNTLADVRMILQGALLTNAVAMILAHNHPSGSIRPSRQDDALTRKIVEAANLMDIKVNDHIILTNEEFYSYCDEGRI